MASKRYIVVGAGLAGCLSAWRLEQAGQKVLLIGNTQLPCASEVAGGIINPVTGRWMTKSWKFDQCIAQATETYRELERKFGIRCYHPTPFIRYCQNEADAKRIQRRMRNPRYATVLENYRHVDETQKTMTDTHGSFSIKQAAHVNLPLVLQTLRHHFSEQGNFLEESFVYSDLEKEGYEWHYHNIAADNILFCEGAGMLGNPWFGHLPLTPVKGETLTFQCDTLHLPEGIYHRGKWLLPLREKHFRIGATYDDNDFSENPTEAGKQELLAVLQSFLAFRHGIKIGQRHAGLRPCTRDFHPLIGSHPDHSGLHVFNGLGSKGALLAPEMIRQFLAYLIESVPLDDEIDCQRYFK